MGKKTRITNNPARRGELAAEKRLFGKNCRYAVAPVHSRYADVGWFVWDAQAPGGGYDPVMGHEPAVIRIASSYEEAIHGLV